MDGTTQLSEHTTTLQLIPGLYHSENTLWGHSQTLATPSRSPQGPKDTGGTEAVATGRLHRFSLGQQANGTLQPLLQRRVELGVVAFHLPRLPLALLAS